MKTMWAASNSAEWSVTAPRVSAPSPRARRGVCDQGAGRWIHRLGLGIAAAALSVMLFASRADNLPAFLPVGNFQKSVDWCVTNRPCSMSILLKFSTATNASEGNFGSYGIAPRFQSYADFESCVANRAMYVYTNYVAKRDNITSPIGLIVIVDPGVDNASLIISTNNIGTFGNITLKSFQNMNMSPEMFIMVHPVITVPGLTEFKVDVESDPPYTYTYPYRAESNLASYPIECTYDDHIIPNMWYSGGHMRVRFTITANGQSRTYTQDGAPLTNAIVRIANPARLIVSAPCGADTVVEMSSNLITWAPIATLPWSLHTNEVPVAVDATLPRAFFRCRSQ